MNNQSTPFTPHPVEAGQDRALRQHLVVRVADDAPEPIRPPRMPLAIQDPHTGVLIFDPDFDPDRRVDDYLCDLCAPSSAP